MVKKERDVTPKLNRKVIGVGNSVGLIVDKRHMETLGWDKGQLVKLTISRKRLIVEKV